MEVRLTKYWILNKLYDSKVAILPELDKTNNFLTLSVILGFRQTHLHSGSMDSYKIVDKYNQTVSVCLCNTLPK